MPWPFFATRASVCPPVRWGCSWRQPLAEATRPESGPARALPSLGLPRSCRTWYTVLTSATPPSRWSCTAGGPTASWPSSSSRATGSVNQAWISAPCVTSTPPRWRSPRCEGPWAEPPAGTGDRGGKRWVSPPRESWLDHSWPVRGSGLRVRSALGCVESVPGGIPSGLRGEGSVAGGGEGSVREEFGNTCLGAVEAGEPGGAPSLGATYIRP